MTYTVEKVLPLFEKAVADRGADFEYPKDNEDWIDDNDQCLYFLKDGTPACIIGVVLHELGQGPDDVTEGMGADLQPLIEFEFDDKAKFLAERAQSYQDNGYTWGEAVKLAKRDVERYDDDGLAL